MADFQRVTDLERSYAKEVLDGQFRKSVEGRMTERLETTFAGIFGVRYAISHVNGTVTMHSALAAAGVGPGDEVIVPALTMASTAFAALYVQARPVFADVDPDTFTINPEDVRRKITSRTRAVIPVSLYGLSPDLDPIMELAREHDLTVIEDNAECVLGSYKGRLVGSIGDMASFSFQSSKHLTSGEGGMLITDDEELALKARRFGNLGFAPTHAKAGGAKMPREKIQDPRFERHLSVGWNYRISELCAAVALAQTERMEEIVDQRRRVADMFRKAVSGCSWLVSQKVPEGYLHSYWTYVMRLETGGRFTWYDFRKKYLEAGGDGYYAAWVPVHLEPAFRNLGYGPGLCPVTEALQPKLLQMKTNYTSLKIAREKADALAETIDYFEKKYRL